MAGKVVYCIGVDENQVCELLIQLKRAGFRDDDLSALVPDKTGTRDFAHERHSKAPEGAIIGGVAGMVVGALAGWIVAETGIDAAWLVHLVEAGPVLAALSCATAIGFAGGVLGALVGMSKPEFEARRYDGKLRQGNILLSIHCDDSRGARIAKDLCRQSGSSGIVATRESRVPAEAV